MPQSTKMQSMFSGYGEGCLFEEQFLDVGAVGEWNREVPEFLKRIEEGGDHRSICIMASLVAEHHVDRLIKIIFPHFERLEGRDFTFSLKINLVEGLHLIPSHITRALQTVRQVRNEFAHNLDLMLVENLKTKFQDRIREVFDYTYSRYEKPGAPRPSVDKGMLEMYKKVAHTAIAGCRAYEPNLSLFQDVTRSAEFRNSLTGVAMARLRVQVGIAVPATPPKKSS